MATTTSSRLRDELLQCEREYLDAVQSKNADAAADLTARESLVVSGRGAMKVDGDMIRKMVTDHEASRKYKLDESAVQVLEVTGDVAIIAYKLQTTEPGGKTSEAFDTDVWVRDNGAWRCALHTEIAAEQSK